MKIIASMIFLLFVIDALAALLPNSKSNASES
jgi:hypothetical protein